MRSALVIALGALTVVGCARPADPPGAAAPGSPGAAWRCDAEGARSLIGTHVGAVTFPREANVRIACTTCAVTEDYQPDRLNLRFDEETGIIESVSCG